MGSLRLCMSLKRHPSRCRRIFRRSALPSKFRSLVPQARGSISPLKFVGNKRPQQVATFSSVHVMASDGSTCSSTWRRSLITVQE